MEVQAKTVAGILGCSQVWLHQLRKAGGGPPFEKRGGHYYYDLGRVLRYVIDREIKQGREARP